MEDLPRRIFADLGEYRRAKKHPGHIDSRFCAKAPVPGANGSRIFF